MIQKLPSQEEIEDLLEENARLTETEKSLKDTTDKVLDQNGSLKEDFSRVRIPSGDTLDMTHTCGLACEKCGFVSQVHQNVVFLDLFNRIEIREYKHTIKSLDDGTNTCHFLTDKFIYQIDDKNIASTFNFDQWSSHKLNILIVIDHHLLRVVTYDSPVLCDCLIKI